MACPVSPSCDWAFFFGFVLGDLFMLMMWCVTKRIADRRRSPPNLICLSMHDIKRNAEMVSNRDNAS